MQVVGMQKRSQALALVLHKSHLVKLSLPNIYIVKKGFWK